jgi:class 3 adenylate cyclase/ligand-binding sensor domain-containing protein
MRRAATTALLHMVLLALPGGHGAWASPQDLAHDSLDLPFTALTINDGLSQGMVNMIAQDQQGFLWIGTKDGLDRYDGYTFKVFRHDPTDSTTVRGNTISGVHVDPAGRLWVGTSNGLDLFDRGTERFHHLDLQTGGKDFGSVTNMETDRNGSLWLACSKAMIRLDFKRPFQGDRPPPFTTHWLSSGYSKLSQTRDGSLWGSMHNLAFRARAMPGGGVDIDTLELFPYDEKRFHLQGLAVAEDTLRGKTYGFSLNGIVEFDTATGGWTKLYETPGAQLDLHVWGPCVDRTGRIWLATYNGIFLFDPVARRMTRLGAVDPEMRNMAHAAKWCFMDNNGMLWLGTYGYGILKFDPRIQRFHAWQDASIRAIGQGNDGTMLITRYDRFLGVFDPARHGYVRELWSMSQIDPAVQRGLPSGTSDYVVQDQDGIYWLANGELLRYDAGHGTIDKYAALPGGGTEGDREGALFPIMLARDGQLWLGGDSALYRFNRGTRRFTPFRYPIASTGDPYDFVTSLIEGSDGRIWAGTMRGVLGLDPRTGAWQHFTHDPSDPASLPVEIVFSLAADPTDPRVIWAGTNGGGISRIDLHKGGVKTWNTKDGLPNDVVYGALFDDAGRLWMSTNRGLSRFDARSGIFRNFRVEDGLQSDEFNRYAYCKDARGRLWFGGVNGFNYFDPAQFEADSTPVPVCITGLLLMNRPAEFGMPGSPLQQPVHLSRGTEIPYSTNMVTFLFAAMELGTPQLHRYRYKLEGFDPDWIESGASNSAIYTNLDPGTYTFRVRARNRDGIWAGAGTAFTLTVRPPWWMTWWFYALCAGVGVGGTLLYIRNLRRQRQVLTETVAHRTRELSRERDRSEELLKNILPVNVASELKMLGRAEARHFGQVTVLFSDFKEFTRVAEQMNAADLVEELNVCFNAFDRIMDKYGVEKIKTIGDSYMAAGGVPDPSGGMPLAVVLAGLEMQRIMAERRKERTAQGAPAFEMRVGIHTGPVVAGIVGLRKFQYDIWGDTVNTASRMESTGAPGEVNISGATWSLVKDAPELGFTPRGLVNAKGKGNLEMYYVHLRIALPEDPADGSPATAVAMDAPDGLAAEAIGIGQGDPPMAGLRVLLAEDNEFNAMVAMGQLENWSPGVQVRHVPNGALAVEALKGGSFDVVLMDIQMPVMNGYDAARAIRALPGAKAHTPVIAMSANVMKAEMDRCTEAGMNGFVPKPFKREELTATISRVLAVRTRNQG